MLKPQHSKKKRNSDYAVSQNQEVAVYIIDLTKGQFQYVGQPVFELTGYPPGYFIKKGFNAFFEILCEEDFGRIKEKYASYLWKPRDFKPSRPEVSSEAFRIERSEDGKVWIENTIVILNYTDDNIPKKALGYLKAVNSSGLTSIEERLKSLKKIILGTTPPEGITQISSLKKWKSSENTATFNQDSLLQIAFNGVLDFRLTKREKEILRHIANGYSAKEIASNLFISESTVVTHRKHLLHKFEVKNVAELIKKASKHFHFN